MIHRAGMVQPSASRFLPSTLLPRKDTINSSRAGEFNWNPLWVMRVKNAKFGGKIPMPLFLYPLFLSSARFPVSPVRKIICLHSFFVCSLSWFLSLRLFSSLRSRFPFKHNWIPLYLFSLSLSLPPPLIQSVAHSQTHTLLLLLLHLHASQLQISVLDSTERRWRALQRPRRELRFEHENFKPSSVLTHNRAKRT